MLLQCQNL
jgi:hypothetical protein